MKQWTAIFVNDNETQVVDLCAPFGAINARSYVEENFAGNLVALIPGSHARVTSVISINRLSKDEQLSFDLNVMPAS